MEKYITYTLIHHVRDFQLLILVIVISNLWITRRSRYHPSVKSFPFVSILVPARNEERNIAKCINSLLAQEYPSFEVLVLDDQSTDNTRNILQAIAIQNDKLTILDGTPIPSGYIGKSWACEQLAEQAKGQLFLFTDADTFHNQDCLKSIVTSLIGEKADLITGFPRQQVHSLGEKLLVPFFSWAMICFTPLWVAYRFRLPALSSAVGQMMLFRRESYFNIGGYAGVSHSIVDDLAMIRLLKSKGLRWRVVYIADIISCRMYQNSCEAYNGFVKNLFAAFDNHFLIYVFVFGWLLVLFWIPIIILLLNMFGFTPYAHLIDLLTCIVLSILIWLLPYREMKLPIHLSLLYPITIIANVYVAIQSLRYSITGNLSWKDRSISKQKWKWL